ncbi:MAG: LamG domain-containing protein [Magnetococcales bacterium]|nr:LamG domain-containing protein [Magnetococcales bacterium]
MHYSNKTKSSPGKANPRHPAAGSMLLWVSFGMIALGSFIAIALPRATGTVNQEKAVANERDLVDMRNAIEGFAAAKYRLPCPDTNNDGLEDCPLTSATTPASAFPYRTIGFSSGRDTYGNAVRYGVYVGTVGSTGSTDSDLTASAHSSSTFCSALDSDTKTTPLTARLHTTDSAGANTVNVPFVVVSPGPRDADRDGADGLYDGNNESTSTNGLRQYDRSSRPTVVNNPPTASDYDDQVVDSSFNRSTTADATHTAPFKALMTRLYPSGCVCTDPITPATGQMVAYYKLTESTITNGTNIINCAGGNNGLFSTSLTGLSGNSAPTLVTDRHSSTSAMDFQSGSNSGLIIPETLLNSNSTFSISLWANLANTSGSGTLISGYGSSSNEFRISRESSGGTRHLLVNIQGSAAVTSVSGFPVSATWRHVVVTRNGTTGVVKLYLDGNATADVTGSAATGSLSIGSNRLVLGFVYTGTAITSSTQWRGGIDDVIFYSKELSGTEVNNLFLATQ